MSNPQWQIVMRGGVASIAYTEGVWRAIGQDVRYLVFTSTWNVASNLRPIERTSTRQLSAGEDVFFLKRRHEQRFETCNKVGGWFELKTAKTRGILISQLNIKLRYCGGSRFRP